MTQAPFMEFRVGCRFRNRFGEYRVVREISDMKILVEYLDGARAGQVQVLTKAIQQRIIENRFGGLSSA